MNRNRSLSLAFIVLILSTALLSFIPPVYAAPDAVPLPEEKLLSDPVFARPGSAYVATGFIDRTRYLLALDVDYAGAHLQGRARVLFVNSTNQPLPNVIFRLYPNHPRFSAADGAFHRRMSIAGVVIDGVLADWKVSDPWETVLTVPFKTPLPPGGKAAIEIGYQIVAIQAADWMDLWEPYPLLAVFDGGGWRTDVDKDNKGLDYVYSESALYAVNLRVSKDLDFRSVGKVKDKQVNGDLQTYTIVTGPVREFSGVLTTQKWGFINGLGGPVPIQVYYLGSAAAATRISQTVISSMTFYDDNFDDYPYAQLTVIVRPFSSGGEEYPSFVYCDIGADRDDAYRKFIAAHEAAHQWFYGLAGNDILRHAWLDESLAQISGYLYYKNVVSPAKADSEYWQHILTWANRYSGQHPIDTPMDGYKDFTEYMSTTYGAGAVFFKDLAAKIGDDAFIEGLKDYVHDVYLGVGTPQQFFDHIQARTKIDLRQMFCQRVGIECKAVG